LLSFQKFAATVFRRIDTLLFKPAKRVPQANLESKNRENRAGAFLSIH
jgi:hypothetical protein